MKRNFIFLTILLIAFGCKKDKSTRNQLFGKWTLVKDSLVYNEPKINPSYRHLDGFEYLEFNANGAGSGGDDPFTYQVSNNEISFNVPAFVDSAGGTVSATKFSNVPILKLDAHHLNLVFQIQYFTMEAGNEKGKRYEYFTK